MSVFTLVYTRALKILKSDSVAIPNPTVVTSGTSTTTTAGKLVCATGLFVTKNVAIGDVVYNTTDLTSATVTKVDSETTLSLSADVVPTGKAFTIYQNSSYSGNSNLGCYLYVGSTGDVSVVTIGGDSVIFSSVPAGTILPVQILFVNATGTVPTSFIALW